MRKLLLYLVLVGSVLVAHGQTIKTVYPYAYSLKRAEYFIDTDPGLGKGTPIAMSAADSVNLTNVSYVVKGLSTGTHKLYARVADSLGRWSTALSYPFWVNDTTKSNLSSNVKNVYTYAYSLKRAEYFIDTDPGLGKGTPIAMSPADSVSLTNVSYVVTGLNTGTHKLFARVADSLGRWSTALSYPFWVNDTTKSNLSSNVKNVYTYAYSLKRAEYFIDTDPGLGKGTPIAMSPADSVNLTNVSYVVTGLSTGTHKLYARVSDSLGRWSTALSYPFWVNDTTKTSSKNDSLAYPKNSKVVYGEYFWGRKDPGYGKGIPMSFKADTAVSVAINVALPDTVLTPGTYYVHYRFKSSQNFWGVTDYFTYEICNNPPDFPKATSAGVVCGGSGIDTLKAMGNKGTKYAWYANSWGGKALTSLNDSSFKTPVISQTTTYYAAQIGTLCNGPRTPATVTVFQTLPKPSVLTQSRCGKGRFMLKASNPLPGTSVRWYASDTAKKHFAQGDSLLTDTLQVGNTILYASTITADASCESPTRTGFLLKVLACTPQTVTFPKEEAQVFGPGQLWKLKATSSSGLPVSYNVSAPGYLIGDTLYASGIGNITVCAIQPGSLTDNFEPARPVCQTIQSIGNRSDLAVGFDEPVCTGNELRFVPSERIGVLSYQWSGPNGFKSTEKTPLIYNVSTADSGSYNLVALTNTDTLRTTFRVKVAESPKKLGLFSKQQNKCVKEFMLFAESNGMERFQWQFNAKQLIGYSDSSLIPGLTGVYSVVGFNKSGCSISSAPLFVDVDPDSVPFLTRLRNPARLKAPLAAQYQWFVDNYYIANSNVQELPLIYNGTYKVQIINTKGCVSYSPEYEIFDDNLPSLRTEMLQNGQVVIDEFTGLNIVPQPAQYEANITWSSPKRGMVTMELVNASGQIVSKMLVSKENEVFVYRLATHDFTSGLYLLRLSCEDKQVTKQMLLSK